MSEFARVENDQVIERRTIDDMPPHKAHLWRPVVIEGDGPMSHTVIEADRVRIVHFVPAPTAADVSAERDRRLRQVTFAGHAFDFCDGRSDINIAGAGTLALAAIIAGAQVGNLRWAGMDRDFTWVAADNAAVPMDAQTCLSFAQAAAVWKARHIHASRAIKDLPEIPADYADDARWP